MLLLFLLLATVVPLVELALLIAIAQRTSLAITIVLVVSTGIIGGLLARSQGWAALRRIQSELGQGKMPGAALLDALMIFLAGALLVTPGVLTDLFGLSLLVPFMRSLYRRGLTYWFRSRLEFRSFGFPPEGPPPPGHTARPRGERSGDERSGDVIDSYVIHPREEDTGDSSPENRSSQKPDPE